MAEITKRDFSRETSHTVRGGATEQDIPLSEWLDEPSITSTNEDIIRAIVTKGFLPRYLYKYRAPDLDTIKAPRRSTENIFSDHILWFGDPLKFNDPFDCQMVLDTNNSLSNITQFLILYRTPELWTSVNSAVMLQAKANAEKLAEELHSNPDKWRTYLHNDFYNQRKTMGICCFSEEYDNILMWSHYANAHTGLCLKYDVLADPSFFFYPKKVIYQQEYPRYNLVDEVLNHSFDASMLFGTKSIAWEYEKEWRIYKHDDEIGAFPFKKEALVEVIFGCNASEENFIPRIRELAQSSGLTHLVYKKAETSKTEFKLEIKNLA